MTESRLSRDRWRTGATSSGELQLADVNKAVGMDIVARHLGTTVADAIAFGDGLNDVEMLAHAGVGVGIEGRISGCWTSRTWLLPGPSSEGLRPSHLPSWD